MSLETGFALRGGTDKGYLKSPPQARKGPGFPPVSSSPPVFNFQQGQVVGLVYDETAATLEYWLDGKYQGCVFSNLPRGEMRFAVSNGWEGTSAFALIGQCLY